MPRLSMQVRVDKIVTAGSDGNRTIVPRHKKKQYRATKKKYNLLRVNSYRAHLESSRERGNLEMESGGPGATEARRSGALEHLSAICWVPQKTVLGVRAPLRTLRRTRQEVPGKVAKMRRNSLSEIMRRNLQVAVRERATTSMPMYHLLVTENHRGCYADRSRHNTKHAYTDIAGTKVS